ncbi:unnamed protein product [Trifolium pratense]|uniref:Uncharacterized protein n=1 Tax=Trifolium pratense TaxID=57577 RepID=A0ACB0LVH7_TRIPR|nr:unnamed protein product [Trifolium pratense]
MRTLNLSNNFNLSNWVFPLDSLSFSKYLDILDLQATNIIGSLPSEMFNSFPNLHTFIISHNQNVGILPESLGKSSVSILRLNNQSGSGFQGTINVISPMHNLSQAWLHNNSFTGRIPNMSDCTHVYDLQLHSNHLFGLIPPSLPALPSLSIVSLGDNWLQGPIPLFRKGVKATVEPNYICRSDVGPCDPQIMVFLEIFETFGPPAFFFNQDNACSIPQSLTTLHQLKNLDVSNNNLSGMIPNFASKVKLNITGNALRSKNMSRQGGGENATTAGDGQTGGSSKANLRHVMWIVGASVISVGFVILIVLIICKHKRYHILVKSRFFKKIKESTDHDVEVFMRSHNSSMPRRYSYAEVKSITHSFRDKLGQGGYGDVYKGILSDGRQVAVKVIKESKGNGQEFINEVASISRTSHMNIVSLLGFCYEVNKRELIYELMPKGSLDKFIYKREIPNTICDFDWNTLFQIAICIPRGLEYLHHGCTSRILHLDIKPQNILLDEDFCPKVSDFGLAKICQKNNSIVSIPGTIGTVGFIAPEVFSRAFGGVSYKSDVYSYGMLILEVIGGRKNFDTGGTSASEMFFPDWIYKDLEQGNNNLENCLEISKEENDMVRKITMVFPLDSLSFSKYLDILDLQATNIIGSLPSEMFNSFPNLHTFIISHNQIDGILPESLGKSSVSILRLNNQSGSGFQGTINVISPMHNLSQAWLHNNSFTGRIPNMSDCTHVYDLQLHSNHLFGLIPPSLPALPSLSIVSLGDNWLQGLIPLFRKGVKATVEPNYICRSDVGPCDPQIMVLVEIFETFGPPAFFFNQDNACSIPQSLTTLHQLKNLDVSNNNLSGMIPNFASKVKLNITGNALLSKNMSRQGGGENATTVGDGQTGGSSKANLRHVIWIVVKSWFFKKIKESIDHDVEVFMRSHNSSMPRRYSYAEVKSITHSFRDKLGQGGYGDVYKGILSYGRQVAVKVIKESKGNGQEFINEVASISRTSHMNIVSLLGFCYEVNKRALIYELMPKGSLDNFIYKREIPNAVCDFDWNTLFQIAIGIARGLEFLHHGCTSRILHLDIKPQNILLDEDFCPKISDFGLAKICQKNNSIVSIPGTIGTVGFIAPEVFSRAFDGVSYKSDVYSYGMLILEVISGRKNYDT